MSVSRVAPFGLHRRLRPHQPEFLVMGFLDRVGKFPLQSANLRRMRRLRCGKTLERLRCLRVGLRQGRLCPAQFSFQFGSSLEQLGLRGRFGLLKFFRAALRPGRDSIQPLVLRRQHPEVLT